MRIRPVAFLKFGFRSRFHLYPTNAAQLYQGLQPGIGFSLFDYYPVAPSFRSFQRLKDGVNAIEEIGFGFVHGSLIQKQVLKSMDSSTIVADVGLRVCAIENPLTSCYT